ncbi:hypothetical protein GWI33_017004 [Rhynchophorus ferrugineus]|uniref:Uncharacterized protein n=1 Tax=Rhynchophorus ferrugineus TaxID=354439 RepID=A0A834HXK8_RHYFE|nr:hypothetical protein GWI33_017004 [Rhynchophorus ferrugineus]
MASVRVMRRPDRNSNDATSSIYKLQILPATGQIKNPEKLRRFSAVMGKVFRDENRRREDKEAEAAGERGGKNLDRFSSHEFVITASQIISS